MIANRGQTNKPIILKIRTIQPKPKIEDVETFRKYGKLHRVGGPAKIFKFGRKEWWMFGCEHRDGAPAVIDPDGTEEWLFRGNFHRDGGPAITYPSGGTEWWSHGCQHREDGPATITPRKIEWYLNGERINSMDEYRVLLGLSDEDVIALILKYGDRFNEYK